MLGVPITTGKSHFYINYIIHCYFTSHFVFMQQSLNNMKLPALFRQQHDWSRIKWHIINVTCPEPIPNGHLCFLLPVPLRTCSYLWDNRSQIKYKLVKQNNLSKFLEHNELHKVIKWYVNSKTQTKLYYDPRTNHIRYVPRFYYALPISHRDKSH